VFWIKEQTREVWSSYESRVLHVIRWVFGGATALADRGGFWGVRRRVDTNGSSDPSESFKASLIRSAGRTIASTFPNAFAPARIQQTIHW
jgi:hypothetical protein